MTPKSIAQVLHASKPREQGDKLDKWQEIVTRFAGQLQSRELHKFLSACGYYANTPDLNARAYDYLEDSLTPDARG